MKSVVDFTGNASRIFGGFVHALVRRRTRNKIGIALDKFDVFFRRHKKPPVYD